MITPKEIVQTEAFDKSAAAVNIAEPCCKSRPEKGAGVTWGGTTLQKRAQERSQRTQRLAAMGEMAAKIAHDIRNPLGCIELFANSLQGSLEREPDLLELVDRISSSVKSIDAIITNLLLFIKPGEATRFECFDIYDVLDDALFFMEHLANSENSVNVSVAYNKRPLFINGDPELMKQVCLNII